MPEHIHMLVSEPRKALLSKAIQALKLSVSVQSRERPFWQARYYDFNVHSEEKPGEKLSYMHRNPVKRGLVPRPEYWPWSSYQHYATGQQGSVEIESFWTQARRDGLIDPMLRNRQLENDRKRNKGWLSSESPRSQKRDLGHPILWATCVPGESPGMRKFHLQKCVPSVFAISAPPFSP
jgi:hypothetical protein